MITGRRKRLISRSVFINSVAIKRAFLSSADKSGSSTNILKRPWKFRLSWIGFQCELLLSRYWIRFTNSITFKSWKSIVYKYITSCWNYVFFFLLTVANFDPRLSYSTCLFIFDMFDKLSMYHYLSDNKCFILLEWQNIWFIFILLELFNKWSTISLTYDIVSYLWDCSSDKRLTCTTNH